MKHSLKEDNRPADLWYWDDWFSSFDVRSCSAAVRGIWVDMLGVMSRANIKGSLTINGRQADSKDLAKITGDPIDIVNSAIKELERNHVFSRLKDGTIFNRRMYDLGELSRLRSKAGSKGGKTRWQTDGKANSKPQATLGNEDGNEDGIKSSLKEKSEVDIRLTQLLIDLMQENNPESSILKRLTPDRQAEWIDQCRLLRERDKKTPEEIERVIRFSQSDSFWKSNILSMPKLREKWDTLWLKAKKNDPIDGVNEWLKDRERDNAK
jgi:hypothetical protein